VSDEGDRLAINHLPLRFSRVVQIPISIEGHRDGMLLSETLTLGIRMSQEAIDRWDVRLIDRLTSDRYLADGGLEGVRFTLDPKMRKSVPQSPISPGSMRPILGKSRVEDARFYLELTPLHDDASMPSDFSLGQNYPNPFNPSTIIPMSIPMESDIHLAVYDLLGREIAVLAQGRYQAGYVDVRFDAGGLASGVYLYRLTTETGMITRKFTVLK
jgi:hypothetical protein